MINHKNVSRSHPINVNKLYENLIYIIFIYLFQYLLLPDLTLCAIGPLLWHWHSLKLSSSGHLSRTSAPSAASSSLPNLIDWLCLLLRFQEVDTPIRRHKLSLFHKFPCCSPGFTILPFSNHRYIIHNKEGAYSNLMKQILIDEANKSLSYYMSKWGF